MKNHYKFWIILSLVIVFAAGVLGGILLEKHVLDKRTERWTRGHNHFPTIHILAEELNLTDEQQKQIMEIFKNNEKRFKNLKDQIDEKLSSIRSQLKDEIKSILSEEQSLKLEAMIERHTFRGREETDRRRGHFKRYENEKGERE